MVSLSSHIFEDPPLPPIMMKIFRHSQFPLERPPRGVLPRGTSIFPLRSVNPKSMESVGRRLSVCAGLDVGVGAMRAKMTFLWMSDPSARFLLNIGQQY